MSGSASAARTGLRTGALVLLVAAAAAWVAAGGPRALRDRLESPEAGIRRALARAAPAEPVPLGAGATLGIARLRFTDPLVDARGDAARVVAVADVDGSVRVRGWEVPVESVGREELRMVRRAGAGWSEDGVPLPRLAGVLAALVRRAAALADGDAAAYAPGVAEDYRDERGGRRELLARLAADLAASPPARYRPLGWQLRIERDRAIVGEDYEIAIGDGAPRRLRARFELRPQAGRWLLAGGL